MMESRTGAGFIPVRQTKKGLRYASDDSDIDLDEIKPPPEFVPHRPETTTQPATQREDPGSRRRARRQNSAAMGSDSDDSGSTSSATVVSSDAEGLDGRGGQRRRRRARQWPAPGDSSPPDLDVGLQMRSGLEEMSDEEGQLPGGFGGMGLQPRRSRDSDWSDDQAPAPLSHLQSGPFNDLGSFEISLPSEIVPAPVRALQEDERPSTSDSRRSMAWGTAEPDPVHPAWTAVDYERSGIPDPSRRPPSPYKGYYAGPSIPSYGPAEEPYVPRADSIAESPTALDSAARSDGWHSDGPGVLVDAAGRRYRCRGEVRQRILCKPESESEADKGEAPEEITGESGQQEFPGTRPGGHGVEGQLCDYPDLGGRPSSSSTWWEGVGSWLGGRHSRDSRASDRSALGFAGSGRFSALIRGGSTEDDMGMGMCDSYGYDSMAGPSSSRSGDGGWSWLGWRPWTAVFPSSRRHAGNGGSPGPRQGRSGLDRQGMVRTARTQGAGSAHATGALSEIVPYDEDPAMYGRNGARYARGPGMVVGNAPAGAGRAPRVAPLLTSPFASIMPLLEPAPEEPEPAPTPRYTFPWR